MTTIEKLNLMANALVFAHRKQDLLEAISELSALQKENDKLRLRLEIFESIDHADGVVALCNTSVDLEYERDSLRTQNRELEEENENLSSELALRIGDKPEITTLGKQNRKLREMCNVKDEALKLASEYCNINTGCSQMENQIVCEQIQSALALQPEK